MQGRRRESLGLDLHETIEQFVHSNVAACGALTAYNRCFPFGENRLGMSLGSADERLGLLFAFSVHRPDVVHDPEFLVSYLFEVPQGQLPPGVPAGRLFGVSPRNASSAFFVTMMRRGGTRIDGSLPVANSS